MNKNRSKERFGEPPSYIDVTKEVESTEGIICGFENYDTSFENESS